MIAVAIASAPLAADAKTLRWSSRSDYLTADPHATNEARTNAINGQIFDGLVMRGRKYELAPALAERWERTSPTRWVFHLRRGVTFHDGTPFTARDVVFSLRRMQEGRAFRLFAASLGDAQEIDPHTVALSTSQPNPLVLETLAESMFVMSEAWCRRHGVQAPQKFADNERTYAMEHAMGTGAFMLVSRDPDSRTVLRRNPRWWGIQAGLFDGNVAEVVHLPLKSDATRIAALLSGDVHVVLDPPPHDLDRLRQSPALRLYEGVENRVLFLSMDQARDELLYANVRGRNPFKDLRVRRAVYQAIDMEAIRRTIMRGLAQPTGMLVPNPALAGIPPELAARLPFDPAAAREALAAAGYPNGFAVTLHCPNDRFINDEKICVAIAAMLAKIRIDVSVDAMPRRIFFPRIRHGDTSFFLYSWGGATDPLFTLVPVVHSRNVRGDGNNNLGGYADARIDAAIDAARVESDAAARRRLAMEALRLHREGFYDIPLHRQMAIWAARANVELVHRPDDWLQLSWVRVR